MRSNDLYVFKTSLSDPCPLCKCDVLKGKNPSCLWCDLLYIELIFIFKFYFLL